MEDFEVLNSLLSLLERCENLVDDNRDCLLSAYGSTDVSLLESRLSNLWWFVYDGLN